jgi:hypothetical protein
MSLPAAKARAATAAPHMHTHAVAVGIDGNHGRAVAQRSRKGREDNGLLVHTRGRKAITGRPTFLDKESLVATGLASLTFCRAASQLEVASQIAQSC